MKILVLDNYDSFTWNLVQGLEAAGGECTVFRSDCITPAGIEALEPARIVLSPGPFGPERTGVCAEVVRVFGSRIPILGVCLGMQIIARETGALIRPSGRPIHGKATPIRHDNRGLLRGLPNPFWGGRYHSLMVDPSPALMVDPSPAQAHSECVVRGNSEALEISAWSEDGQVMGCRMRGRRVEGVLFHPESFLTEQGFRVFENFLGDHVV